MAVLRVREYTTLARSVNSQSAPLAQEPPTNVTEVTTTSSEQTIELGESTVYVKIEVWSGSITNGLRYHVAPSSPDSTGEEAGVQPPARMPLAFGVIGGQTLALSEA